MLSTGRSAVLAEILSLTIAAAQAAEDRQWQQVRSLDRKRLELMDRFFATPPSATERTELGDQLRELLSQDTRLVEIARSARDGLGAQLDKSRQHRAGVATYEEVSV